MNKMLIGILTICVIIVGFGMSRGYVPHLVTSLTTLSTYAAPAVIFVGVIIFGIIMEIRRWFKK